MFTAITRTMGDARSHRAALTLANCGAASGDVCGLGKTASPLKKRLVTLTQLKQSFNPGKRIHLAERRNCALRTLTFWTWIASRNELPTVIALWSNRSTAKSPSLRARAPASDALSLTSSPLMA